MGMQICEVHRLGLVDYEEAWRLQETWAEEIGRGERPASLLLLEHPPTYTFGRRGQAENLLWDEAELARRGIRVYWVDRGGDVTYHGPGQLVGYPLLPLQPLAPEQGQPGRLRANYMEYLHQLEQVLILTLDQLGVEATRQAGKTGVWLPGDRCKIASIGVRVDVRGVTRHGFALNVAPEMSHWEGIVACGLEAMQMTSLAELIEPVPTIDQVIELLFPCFGEIFHYRMKDCTQVNSVGMMPW
jgi:lipoate-protein ligase B